jgi:hypothetical protein
MNYRRMRLTTYAACIALCMGFWYVVCLGLVCLLDRIFG